MKSTHEISIEMAADVVRLTQDMERARSVVERGMQGMAKSADIAINALGALGVTLSVGAIVGMVRELGRVSTEITNMSRAAGLGVEQFQILAFGAERFGVSQEKLADIVKDTQDKIGDFVQTGGGAMADFFENIAPRVGVTVDQFRALNGADALQLYVSSLEKANLSQADMVFYMEAIASDSTLLLPLLQDGGKALADYGDSALRMGKILDQEAVEAARNFDNAMKDVADSVDGAKTQMVVGLAPAMIEVAASISSLIQDLPRLTEKFGPYLAGGAVTLGLMALPGLITAISATILTRLLPALIAIGPYLAAFAAVAGTIGFVINRIQDANSRLATVEKAQAQVEILQKQIAAAEKLMESGQGSVVTQKRLEAMRRELGIATKAVDDFRSANEKIPPVVDVVGNSFSKGKKSAAELVAEKKRVAGVSKAVADQLKLLAKAHDEANAARVAAVAVEAQAAVKIQEQVEQIREQIKAFGMSRDELRRLNREQLDFVQSTIEMRLRMAEAGFSSRDLIPEYQRQLQAIQDLKAGQDELYELQDAEGYRQAAEQLVAANKSVANQFEADLIASIKSAFLAGGSFGEAFARGVKAELIEAFLDPSLGAAINKARAGDYSGVAAIAGGAGMAGGSGAALGALLSNANNITSNLISITGASGDAAATMLQLGNNLSKIAPYAGSIAAVFQGDIKGGVGSAIGTYIGGAIAGPIGAAIGSTLGGMLGGRGKISATALGPEFGASLIDQLDTTFKDLANTLGGNAAQVAFNAFGNTGRQGQNPNFTLSASSGGKSIFSSHQTAEGQRDGLFLQGEIALNEANIADQTTRAIVAALKLGDFEDNIDALIESLDPFNATLDQLNQGIQDAQALAGFNELFASFDSNLKGLSGASSEVVKSFLSMVGGLDGLNQGLGSFLDLYYSEAEKTELAVKQVVGVFGQLNIAVPTTLGAYRSLIEAQDLLTESGRRAYVSLLGLGPTFASTVEQIETQLGKGFADSVGRAAGAAELSEYVSAVLNGSMTVDAAMQTIGSSAEALAFAAGKSAETIDQAYARLMDASRTNDQIAQERIALERRLMLATGGSAAAVAMARGEIDLYNLALYDQVVAAEEAAAQQSKLQNEAAQALERYQSALSGSTRAIEDEINRLRGIDSAGPGGLADLQARFALMTAGARAGDLDMLAKLPDLSKAIEAATLESTTNLLDVRRVRAQLANSLSATIGSVGMGQTVAPPIIPSASLNSPTQQSNSSLLIELQGLRGQVEMLLLTSQQAVVNTGRGTRILEDVTQGGTSVRVAEVAP